MNSTIHYEVHESLKSLKQQLKVRLEKAPRRIDILTQLALTGAFEIGHKLESNSHIYLFSEKLPLSTTQELIEDIYIQHRQPMPMTFINSVGNATVFYLAKALNVRASCQFMALTPEFIQLLFLRIQTLHASKAAPSVLFGFLFEEELASCWLRVSLGPFLIKTPAFQHTVTQNLSSKHIYNQLNRWFNPDEQNPLTSL